MAVSRAFPSADPVDRLAHPVSVRNQASNVGERLRRALEHGRNVAITPFLDTSLPVVRRITVGQEAPLLERGPQTILQKDAGVVFEDSRPAEIVPLNAC